MLIVCGGDNATYHGPGSPLGRDPAELIAQLHHYAELGVGHLQIGVSADRPDDMLTVVQALGRDVVPALRATT